jgi:hypothetical protein
MAWSQSNGLHGDDVFDHDAGILNDNAIDHQLKDLLLDGKGGIDQGVLVAGCTPSKPPQQGGPMNHIPTSWGILQL